MTQHEQRSLPLGRIALVIAALIAAFAIGYAISRGQDDGAAQAPAAMASASAPTLDELEAKTRSDPDDAAAWQQLGAAYFGENRFADAVQAYRRAVQLEPGQAATWSALGEALVMASEQDPMPAEAVEAFNKAVELQASDPRARYFLAVKKDLEGDHRGAIDDWLALLGDTPADAPWHGDVVRTIQQVAKINNIDVSGDLARAGASSPPAAPAMGAIPGPNAADLAAASQIPPGEQRAMAEEMVSRLESRLESNPANVDGWIMLMRSRMTLDQPAKAGEALADALAANPGRADFLNQQAAILNVPQ